MAEGVRIDAELSAALVAAQFPEWRALPVRPVAHGGHDNRTFRLGADMLVRLPSAEGYAAAVADEERFARDLGGFLVALRAQDPTDAPTPAPCPESAQPAAHFRNWSRFPHSRWSDSDRHRRESPRLGPLS